MEIANTHIATALHNLFGESHELSEHTGSDPVAAAEGDRVMNKVLNRAVLTCAVLSSLVGASMKADAAAFATICNDLSCTGGDDFIVQDNGAGDTSPILGAINLSASAFGFNVLVNTSQSKPVVGSAGAPQLDVTFSATTNSNAAGTVFLYMSDTDFVGPQSFLLSV